MTVTYTAEVATCRHLGCFLKLLLRWRGSIYKLVWLDLIVFLILYYTLNMTYRYALNDNGQRELVDYCSSYSSLIPLTFVLGYYVSLVMKRWWDQYMAIPWPDSIAVFVSANVHGFDEHARLMRRTVMRYVCLCLTMVLTMISKRVKKRFPTYTHLVDAGLLLDNEKEIFERLDEPFPNYPKHWMPIVWASSIIIRARKEGKIRDDYAVKTIIDELNKFRGLCGSLLYYDWISIPLVYTQVVTLAVYTFFLSSVIAQQWVILPEGENKYHLLGFFPWFTTMQFFFYMGYLKVAESLINPFGDNDEDFELNWMINRNLQVSFLIVDEMHQEHPELTRDQYWDNIVPREIPYMDENQRQEPPEPSTTKMEQKGQSLFTKSIVSLFSQMEIKRIKSTESKIETQEEASKRRKRVGSISSLEPSFLFTIQGETDTISVDPEALNFDELIVQRNRERNERMRNRFISIQRARHITTSTEEDSTFLNTIEEEFVDEENNDKE